MAPTDVAVRPGAAPSRRHSSPSSSPGSATPTWDAGCARCSGPSCPSWASRPSAACALSPDRSELVDHAGRSGRPHARARSSSSSTCVYRLARAARRLPPGPRPAASARRARGCSPRPASWPSSSCCSPATSPSRSPSSSPRDTINDITENAGDETEIADLEALAARTTRLRPQLRGASSRPCRRTLDASPGVLAPPAEPTRRRRPTPSDASRRHERRRSRRSGTARSASTSCSSAPMAVARGSSSYLTDTMIVGQRRPHHRAAWPSSRCRATRSACRCRRAGRPHASSGGTYNNKINTLYTVARGRPDLFPGNDTERGFDALMGALGELYGLDIDYYVAVDLRQLPQRRQHARRRRRGRPAAGLRRRATPPTTGAASSSSTCRRA